MSRPASQEPALGRLRRLETRRLAQRAKEVLLESIVSGDFPDFLPSEEQLAEELGVSRTTVREALRSLEEEGLITRQRGIGTWVNKHVVRSISMNRTEGFYDLIRDAGYEPEINSTEISEGDAVPEVARRLGIEEGKSVRMCLVERLFLASGQPVIHLTENLPLEEIARPFAAEEFPDSVFVFADSFCRSPIDHTVVEIIPVVANTEISQRLPLKKGEPLLCLIETHYTSDGRPIMVSVIHVVDRLLRLTVVRKRM